MGAVSRVESRSTDSERGPTSLVPAKKVALFEIQNPICMSDSSKIKVECQLGVVCRQTDESEAHA